MKRDEVLKMIGTLIADVSVPLSEEELHNGWTIQSQQAFQKTLKRIETDIREGRDLPPLFLARGLDHWGVEAGELLRRAAQVSNHLRQVM
jgi:hypothetical protein